MSKIEEAYCIEYEDIIDAEKAYELYWDGTISDFKGFQCVDPNCTAQITCRNMAKERNLMKQIPHFRCYGEHSKECGYIRNFKVEDTPDNKQKSKSSRKYLNDKVDIFTFTRPKKNASISKVKKDRNSQEVMKSKQEALRNYENQGKRNATYYSIKSLVTKYIKYQKSGELDNHSIKFKNYDIRYNKMFIDTSFCSVLDNLDSDERIYYGIGQIRKVGSTGSFLIICEEAFKEEEFPTSIYISNETIEKYYCNHLMREKLNKLVEMPNAKIMFYILTKPYKNENRKRVNLWLNNMDYFECYSIDDK